MKLYSTNNTDLRVNLKEAIFRGLPSDNGLFMPTDIPVLPNDFFKALPDLSFPALSYEVARHIIQGAIPDKDLKDIIERAINFPAPVVRLDEHTFILELFHGPSLAFKDFGARFMAETMSWFNRGEENDLTILVATSGDTGGAVAAGFYQTPGIKVIILYPSGKVSPLQEKQLTTLGHNITALEIDGTFDDCQALVKKAFLDNEVTQRMRLSSANSINIARLIPQSFYYFEAYKQVLKQSSPGANITFSVPSGNFGNLTAGLIAKKMGLNIHQFIAATNTNDVVPAYLSQGTYTPRPSVRTLSNAMDVGNPSNFVRMMDLYGSAWDAIKNDIQGYAFNDEDTAQTMQAVDKQFQYILDPHGAVGYKAFKTYQLQHPNDLGVILETAHPAKFKEDVERILSHPIHVPERLAQLEHLPKRSTPLGTAYAPFKDWLLESL